MMFEWKEFIDIARHLIDEGGKTLPDEAAYRSAVNRAYYGAYGHCTKYAIQNFNFEPEGNGLDHTLLRQCFRDKGRDTRDDDLLDIASSLYELHEWRKDCDYHSVTRSPNAPDQMAIEAITEAQEIINKLVNTSTFFSVSSN